MRIRHIFPSNSCRSEVTGDRAFFMRNSAGNFLTFFTTPQTRYEGWFMPAETAFIKLLERVSLRQSGEELSVTGIINSGFNVYWEYNDGTQLAWKLTPNVSGLTISLSEKRDIRLTLDIRHMYSQPTLGRTHEVLSKKNGLLLRYSDQTLGKALYLHIRSNDTLSQPNLWRSQEYIRDRVRNSNPTSLYVYEGLESTTDLIGLGAGWTPEEAENASLAAFKQRPQTPTISINYTHDTMLSEVTTAKATTQQALRWLQTVNGIYAGLPWFHQVWSRDELIAALGFNREQQREVIERYLGFPLENGELPTFQGSGTTCADGVGWLCLLVREYGTANLSPETHTRLEHFLTKARDQLKATRQAGHRFIFSGHNATWMDTIGREGFRIEIQCMYALLLELLYELTDTEEFEQERLQFLGAVRQQFWNHTYLADGLGDASLRPNVFIAYLLQPELLSENMWLSCFDQALKFLGTSWGGLRSLQSDHPEYQPISTGEDNRSYHNGDSWFFVNNLAGIALTRLNQRRYGKTVVDILQASTNEILWEHMVGQPGEISSANSLQSFGCGIQAFSGGAYLALLKELEGYSAAQERDSMSFFWDSTASSTAVSFFK